MKRVLRIVVPLGMLPLLSGCIAWEIRDEIRTTNQHLCEVSPALVHTLHTVEDTKQQIIGTQALLEEVRQSIVTTQSQLVSVQQALVQTDAHLQEVGGTLGQTNPTLSNLDGGLERMRMLNEMHATLRDIHKTLGPLSSAMSSLGGAMSFLGMSDSSRDLLAEDDPAAGGTAATGGASPAAAAGTGSAGGAAEPDVADAGVSGGSGATGTKADASKRADPLLGTWVLVYPTSTTPAPGVAGQTPVGAGRQITVITADGKFLTAEDGQRPRSGRWTRQGRTLTYTYDEPVQGSGAGAAPEVVTVELLTLNSRTLTVRKGDAIRVHARP